MKTTEQITESDKVFLNALVSTNFPRLVTDQKEYTVCIAKEDTQKGHTYLASITQIQSQTKQVFTFTR